jgi:hypothetical protein
VTWKEVLGAADDEFVFFERYAGVARLIGRVLEDVQALPASEDPEYLLSQIRPLNDLAAMLTSARHQDVGQFREVISPTVVQAVQYCSRALRRAGVRAPVLPMEAVERLLKDVNDWMSEVAADDSLTVAAKRLLTHRLTSLQEALLDIRINGFDGVEEAVSALVGTVVTAPEVGNRSFVERCWAFWARVVGMAEGAQKIAAATEGAAKAIDTVSKITGSH